jgi:TPR repeat protein
MAVKFDMIQFLSMRFRQGDAPGKCRSRRPYWQRRRIASLGLLMFVGLGTALNSANSAWADTDAGIADMKQGYYIKAIAELKPAAEAGDPRAQTNLASIYYYGLGIAANFDKAFQWYRVAALQGDPDGQIGLAILYAQGQGVPADLAIAHMWLTLALDRLPQGRDRDRVSLDRDAIADRLSTAQLQESAGLVQAWYKNHQAP